jgi:hypothetical protein
MQVFGSSMHVARGADLATVNSKDERSVVWVTVNVRRNSYGSYQSLPWGTSRELNHSRGPGVAHRDYFAWRKWGISEQQEWFSQVTFTFDGIWRHIGAIFCNWKWMVWCTQRIANVWHFAIVRVWRVHTWRVHWGQDMRTYLLLHNCCQASWYLTGSSFWVSISKSAASIHWNDKIRMNEWKCPDYSGIRLVVCLWLGECLA